MTVRPYTVLIRGDAVHIAFEPFEAAAPLIADEWTSDGTFTGFWPATQHAADLARDPVARWWAESWPARAGRVDHE